MFEEYFGQLIIVNLLDSTFIKGELIKEEPDFIVLGTLRNTRIIRKLQITSIKISNGGCKK